MQRCPLAQWKQFIIFTPQHIYITALNLNDVVRVNYMNANDVSETLQTQITDTGTRKTEGYQCSASSE